MKTTMILAVFAIGMIGAAAPADEPVMHVGILGSWAVAGETIEAPLATPEDEKLFHQNYDAVITEAERESPEDRSAACEVLVGRASAAAVSAGVKRLLLVAAMKLDLRSNAPQDELRATAAVALKSLEGNGLAVIAKRIEILEAINGAINTATPEYWPAVISDQCFLLAELRFDLGRNSEAKDAFDKGKLWTEKDAAYGKRMKFAIEKFTLLLREQIDNDKKLATMANDPAANRAKGICLLARGWNAADAAPYLSKSGVPELARLGKAMMVAPGVSARLEVATAAAAALAVVDGDAQYALAYLAQAQALTVESDSAATETDKTRAELARVKVEKIAATRPATGGAAGFFGVQTSGAKIVFIFDSSGSMIDNFGFIKKELHQAVGTLSPTQRFGVVMFSDKAAVLNGGKLAEAGTHGNSVLAEVDKSAAQGPNDGQLAPFLDAFAKAFAMQPDTIVFLTDGKFDPKLVAAVKQLNATRKVEIDTIAFVTEDAGYKVQMQQLAGENGGTYRFVSEKDLKP